MTAIDNSRHGKRALLYDGHNRRSRLQDRELKWRKWRRRARRWLINMTESWR